MRYTVVLIFTPAMYQQNSSVLVHIGVQSSDVLIACDMLRASFSERPMLLQTPRQGSVASSAEGVSLRAHFQGQTTSLFGL